MSKWIDADALIAELQKDEERFDKEADDARNDPSYTKDYSDAMWSRANGIRDAMIEIYDAPSIDIVFCKECRHSFINENHLQKPRICGLTKMCGTTKDDWFCADGEREGE